MQRFPRPRRLLASLAILALTPGTAWAHEFPGAGDFYGGMLHVVTSLEMLLAIVALGILAGQQGRSAALGALGAFPVATLAGGLIALSGRDLPGVTVPLLAAMVILGIMVAAARPLPRGAIIALAVVVGIAVGVGNGVEMGEGTVAWRFLPGVALAGTLVLAWLVGFVRWLRAPWTGIAVRVGGSWIAATGMMVLALRP